MSSLYDRVGGEQGVIKLVDAFYDRVFLDKELAPFFDSARVDRLKKMQKEFFTIALGGPGEYSDVNLSHAHHGKGIEIQHFRAFVQHMFDSLKELDLSEEEIYQIASHVNTYVGDVVEGAGSIM